MALARGKATNFDIMIDLEKLKTELAERGITYAAAAKMIGRREAMTFSNLMNGHSQWRLGDITELLKQTEIPLTKILVDDFRPFL